MIGFFIHRLISRHFSTLIQLNHNHWAALMSPREFFTCLVTFSVSGFIFAVFFRLYVFTMFRLFVSLYNRSSEKFHNIVK